MSKSSKLLSIVCPYYLDIVDNWAPFTKEEELEFRDKMIAEGNIKRLKDELVLRNVGILNTFGKRWLYIYSPEDTVSIGITALYEAVNKFDFNRRDVKFTTYAQWYITRIYQRSKDKYHNEIDENSIRWDKPILTDEDDGSTCLGDFIQDLILPEAKVINNEPWQIKDENVIDVIRNIIATKATKSNITIINTFLFVISHPEMTMEKVAEEMVKAGLEVDGCIKTRERIRQRFEKGKHLFIDAIREVVAKQMTTDTSKKTSLEDQYDVETVKYSMIGAKPKSSKPLSTSSLTDRADKLFQDLFGVKFKHGRPTQYHTRKSSTSTWYEKLEHQLNEIRRTSVHV